MLTTAATPATNQQKAESLRPRPLPFRPDAPKLKQLARSEAAAATCPLRLTPLCCHQNLPPVSGCVAAGGKRGETDGGGADAHVDTVAAATPADLAPAVGSTKQDGLDEEDVSSLCRKNPAREKISTRCKECVDCVAVSVLLLLRLRQLFLLMPLLLLLLPPLPPLPLLLTSLLMFRIGPKDHNNTGVHANSLPLEDDFPRIMI